MEDLMQKNSASENDLTVLTLNCLAWNFTTQNAKLLTLLSSRLT